MNPSLTWLELRRQMAEIDDDIRQLQKKRAALAGQAKEALVQMSDQEREETLRIPEEMFHRRGYPAIPVTSGVSGQKATS